MVQLACNEADVNSRMTKLVFTGLSNLQSRENPSQDHQLLAHSATGAVERKHILPVRFAFFDQHVIIVDHDIKNKVKALKTWQVIIRYDAFPDSNTENKEGWLTSMTTNI